MQYDQKQFTQKGLNMFTSALSQKQPIVIDKVIVDDLPTNNFSNLALLSMDSFADALSYQANYTTVNGNLLTVDAVMSNKDFNSSYTINEVGLVGHINNDMSSQALIAVLVASDPFTLPAQQSGETPSQFIPNITLSFGDNNMNQVPVMVSDSAYIAQKDLDRLVSEYNYLKIGDADNRYVKQQDFNNEVNDYFNGGQIKNGYNLNNYTWNGSFTLYNVDLSTLIGIDGLSVGYKNFYGVLKVETYGDYTRQFLYDNINNFWYRYSGNSNYWRKISTDDEIENTKNNIQDELNDKADKAGEGEVHNGDNLNNYTWTGEFTAYNISLDTLTGNDGLPKGYGGFYGILKVDSFNNYTRQFLYDNLNNLWYRYAGVSNYWHQITNQSYVDDSVKKTYNSANSYTDQQINKYHGDGTINAGDNLNNYTWNGEFTLYNVDISTLIGIDGLPNGYKQFYGVMKVETISGYIRQFLYDNLNNIWYRYAGLSNYWHKVASQIDIDNQVANSFNSANSYTDQKYNDLQDKNNILSSRLEDYQKPNLIDNEATGNQKSGYTTNLYPQNQILLKAGNTYYLSGKSIDNVIDHVQFNLVKDAWNSDNELYNGENADRTVIQNWATNGKIAITKYYIKKDTLVYPGFCTVFGNGVGTDFCVTQSNDYVPFDIAQQNKASIQSEGQFTDDYQAPNLIDNTDNPIEIKQNSTNGFGLSFDVASFNVEAGKNYCINANYNISGNSSNNLWMILSGAVTKSQAVYQNNSASSVKFTAQNSGNVKMQMSMYQYDNNTNHYYYNHLTVTQSDNPVPYKNAQRNKLWNDRITNKTNDLSQNITNLNNQYHGNGNIANGNNLNGYTWNGEFSAYNIDLGTLEGSDGLPKNYGGFYGVLKVENYNNYVRQFLYDNLGNSWYRYNGNGDWWHKVANDSSAILKQIPVQSYTNTTGEDAQSVVNAVQAFYDTDSGQISLHGFFKPANIYNTLKLDLSNVSNYLNSPVKIVGSYYNGNSAFEYPQGINNNTITFQFNNINQVSLESCSIEVAPV